VHSNISARANSEYVFRLQDQNTAVVFAGSGSVRTFRHNFHLRLAEVFSNFEWILQNHPQEFNRAEFDLYERFYEELLSSNQVSSVLRGVHDRVVERIHGRTPA
jgi:hypothetical protein